MIDDELVKLWKEAWPATGELLDWVAKKQKLEQEWPPLPHEVGDEIVTISAFGDGGVYAKVISTNYVEIAGSPSTGSAQAISGTKMVKFLEWYLKRGWVCVGSGNLAAIKKLELT